MQAVHNNIIASLDIGSSKIVCLIGFLNTEGQLYIKGIGHKEARGIKNGEIDDIKTLRKAIVKAISAAESMAKCNIDEVVVNICGNGVRSSTSTSEISLNNRAITKADVLKIASSLETEYAKNKKELIHLIPTGYYVDSVKVNRPFDMVSNQFRVDFNTVYSDALKFNNIKSSLKKTPIKITKFIYTPYASALACLSAMEKESGTLLIDIGAGNTSFAVMHDNLFIFGGSIPLGGNIITRDIATILKIDMDIAERIKVLNTNLTLDKNEELATIQLGTGVPESYSHILKVNKKIINNIYKERIKEIILIIIDILKKKSLVTKVKKIVLTGGSASVNAVDYFVSRLVNIDTRVGMPDFSVITNNSIQTTKIRNPVFSCAIGLILNMQKTLSARQEDYKNMKNSKINKFFNSLVKLLIS